jgi:hypothetical protein
MRNVLFLFLFMATIACSQKKGKDSNTDKFGDGRKLMELTDKKMTELSGLAASANNPGMLWTHNDSGNSAEIFLIDQKLNIKLTIKLKGIINRDWEDIAVGPGPVEGKNYLYVADIGDNMALFPYKFVYRFEEPVIPSSQNQITISEFETITFQLADKQKDTESLMIHPKTKSN